ncbi:S8 family peptidase [Shouchella shacheensis]|uniref:S8 family peptidase n=1 Tax=Shouchella shacheensis TaxID=1649580 RepID=UPI00073FF5B7|nr:S8 family serine peptidase [Shouchella shacheensis]
MYFTNKKPFIVVLALLFALSPFGSAFANQGDGGTPELAELYGTIDVSSTEPTTVIVELKEEAVVEAKQNGQAQSESEIESKRNQLVADLEDEVGNVEVKQEYDYLLSGLSVELPANEIQYILSHEEVRAVYPDVEYEVPEMETAPDDAVPYMFDSAPFIGANEVWEDLGYTGEEVTVAIIDTGVDYTHPDLAHAFGDYKGRDLVDNDDDPQETPPGDPRGNATNHGSHVAGTVAANGEIKGVAPDATLLAYRVLGPGGSGSTANVIAGIEQAVQDGADVMNLSLGNTLNDPDFATSLALDRAMAEGVMAVTSNGNAGPAEWTVGSPGTSRDAISVGATQLPYAVFNAQVETDGGVSYPSAAVMGPGPEEGITQLDGNDYELVDVGLAFTEDFEGVDVEGKVALISRGDLPFVEKVDNAKEAGAAGVIMYNNVDGDMPYIPSLALPTVMLNNVDGQKMLDELEAGNNTITISIEEAGEVGESVADFSSRGPVMDTWMIKPDVVAPGVNITSTVPTHNPENPHGYAALQGTSMAAPHVAGAAALILEAHPDWGVEEVKASLMNTAERITDPDGTMYAHNTQGAGSIRVPEAIQTKTLAVPGSYSFGKFAKDNGRQVERQHFEIKNLSDERKRYSFDVEFKGDPQGIRVNTSNNLNVQPGKSQKVNMNVQVNASQLEQGYYEGMIRISDGEETFEVPTILFVQEPDYPRVTSLAVSEASEGFALNFYLPGGADTVQVAAYDENLQPLGAGPSTEDLSEGYNTIEWDGTIATGEVIENGNYVAVFATANGQTDYVLAELDF